MILDEIVKNKELELKQIDNNIRDFKAALLKDKLALIAEIKKASPSKGDIKLNVNIEEQAKMYENAGANAISVLTDKKYFKGDINFIKQIKRVVKIPIFRKDFIIKYSQVYESKIFGADAILLIASILDENKLKNLVRLTHEIGLQCLVETHSKEDVKKALNTDADIIGINSRDLKTMKIDLNTVVEMAKLMPEEKILIAESGINTKADVKKLKLANINGILVGTSLMQAKDVKKKICELKFVE